MTAYFSEMGLAQIDRKLVEQAAIVVEAGQQVGEEAGISCDWHDNFGFEEARRRLDLESGRLKALKELRETAQLAPLPDSKSDHVAIGSSVAFALGDQEKTMVIGAWGETKPAIGIVAYDSPIVKLVIGMKVGEVRDVSFQGAETEVELTSLSNDCQVYLETIHKFYGIDESD